MTSLPLTRAAFPWLSHRSLAEVHETETLRARKRSGERWNGNASARLQALEARARYPIYDTPPKGAA